MKNKVRNVSILVALLSVSFLAGHWYQKNPLADSNATAVRKVLYYVDPMNPALKSDKPGIAPCGMPLEAVYADDATDRSGMPPGAVRVTPEQQQLIGVKVATVAETSWSHTLRVLGRVAADEDRVYRINSATDGWVKSTRDVTTGSLVRKDELLATFYSPEFFPAIKAFLYGMRSLERFETNGKETPEQIKLTKENIDNYRVSLSNLGMSDYQIDEMQRTRQGPDKIEIRAPAAGFVIVRNISLGQRFVKGTELYRIADLRHVWILADIFENESAYFRPGAVVRVMLPNQKGTFHAKVSAILPQFDPASRTLKLRLDVDNPDLLLRPDMFVDVDLPVSFPRAIAVPVDAVRRSGLKKTVYIDLGKGFFEPRDVETGWQFGDRVEIVRGLDARRADRRLGELSHRLRKQDEGGRGGNPRNRNRGGGPCLRSDRRRGEGEGRRMDERLPRQEILFLFRSLQTAIRRGSAALSEKGGRNRTEGNLRDRQYRDDREGLRRQGPCLRQIFQGGHRRRFGKNRRVPGEEVLFLFRRLQEPVPKGSGSVRGRSASDALHEGGRTRGRSAMINRIIDFSVNNKFIVFLLVAVACIAGWWSMQHVSLDAIPDLSETQVIIYSRWDRSPDIIEDQVTYPIVTAMLGAPQVKTVRGFSDFGYSFVYVIFEDGTDIYWARSRTLEYLSGVTQRLPAGRQDRDRAGCHRPRLGLPVCPGR